jgi:hypothetical protein
MWHSQWSYMQTGIAENSLSELYCGALCRLKYFNNLACELFSLVDGICYFGHTTEGSTMNTPPGLSNVYVTPGRN